LQFSNISASALATDKICGKVTTLQANTTTAGYPVSQQTHKQPISATYAIWLGVRKN
jgi:hypothetical protein